MRGIEGSKKSLEQYNIVGRKLDKVKGKTNTGWAVHRS